MSYGSKQSLSKKYDGTKPYSNTTTQHNSDVAPASDLPAFDINKPSKELFDSTAEKCAKAISASNKNTNKPSQIRRFYDELLMWEERSQTQEDFQNNLPFIYMMKSKVAYAFGRKNVDKTFQDFMKNLINQIKDDDKKTLKNAKLFMEAMLGFYKENRPED